MTEVLAREVRAVDPRTDAAWAWLVRRRDGDVFQSAAWARVLAKSYGLDPVALVTEGPGGEPRSGMVSCTLDDLLGRRTVSLPFSDYCDPLLGDPGDWALLSAKWLEGDGPARVRCLHERAPNGDPRLAESGWAWWHATDLRRDEGELWEALHPTAQRAIGKARRAGVTVRPARDRADLRAFFELHLGLRKEKYRLLAQPYRFFEALWEEFLEPGDGVLLLAEHESRVVAGVMLLQHGAKLYYKLNASDPARLELRPNDLLVWHALRHGVANGCERLDFGVSDHDQPGLVRYKRKFADMEGRVVTLQRPDRGPLDRRADELRELLGALTGLFTSAGVPDSVTEDAGDRLYRFFT